MCRCVSAPMCQCADRSVAMCQCTDISVPLCQYVGVSVCWCVSVNVSVYRCVMVSGSLSPVGGPCCRRVARRRPAVVRPPHAAVKYTGSTTASARRQRLCAVLEGRSAVGPRVDLTLPPLPDVPGHTHTGRHA